jgi:hypothetical protein
MTGLQWAYLGFALSGVALVTIGSLWLLIQALG